MGVEPTMADLQSAALASWLRRLIGRFCDSMPQISAFQIPVSRSPASPTSVRRQRLSEIARHLPVVIRDTPRAAFVRPAIATVAGVAAVSPAPAAARLIHPPECRTVRVRKPAGLGQGAYFRQKLTPRQSGAVVPLTRAALLSSATEAPRQYVRSAKVHRFARLCLGGGSCGFRARLRASKL